MPKCPFLSANSRKHALIALYLKKKQYINGHFKSLLKLLKNILSTINCSTHNSGVTTVSVDVINLRWQHTVECWTCNSQVACLIHSRDMACNTQKSMAQVAMLRGTSSHYWHVQVDSGICYLKLVMCQCHWHCPGNWHHTNTESQNMLPYVDTFYLLWQARCSKNRTNDVTLLLAVMTEFSTDRPVIHFSHAAGNWLSSAGDSLSLLSMRLAILIWWYIFLYKERLTLLGWQTAFLT